VILADVLYDPFHGATAQHLPGPESCSRRQGRGVRSPGTLLVAANGGVALADTVTTAGALVRASHSTAAAQPIVTNRSVRICSNFAAAGSSFVLKF